MSKQHEQLLYRITEAADVLGFSRAKTYELVAEGIIPTITIGGCKRVPAAGLKDEVDRLAQAAAKAAGPDVSPAKRRRG